MDAQATSEATGALVALVQCLVRLEAEEGYASPRLLAQPEVLEENRFLAARDGVEAELVDPDEEALVPLRTVLSRAAPGARPARRGARLRCGARRRRGAGRVPVGPPPARRLARAGPPARPGQAPGQGLRAVPGSVDVGAATARGAPGRVAPPLTRSAQWVDAGRRRPRRLAPRIGRRVPGVDPRARRGRGSAAGGLASRAVDGVAPLAAASRARPRADRLASRLRLAGAVARAPATGRRR